jgi:hypothetical protein
MLITGNCTHTKNKAKAEIMSEFECTDLGPVSKILGYKVKHNLPNWQTKIHQTEYIEKLLTRFRMNDVNPVTTPLDPNVNLTHPDPGTKVLSDVPYCELVRSLQYAATGMHPNICFAVSLLSCYLDRPEQQHWTTGRRILQYLAGTHSLGIIFDGSAKVISILLGYSDANFATCKVTRKSVSGYVFQIAGGLVSWQSHQETLTALSTMDAKYTALSQSVWEATWLRSLLGELGFEQHTPTPMLCDNKAAIKLSKDSKFHSHAKHIDIRHHHVLDLVCLDKISIPYVCSGQNTADQFTKPLPRDQHSALIMVYGMAT